MKTDEIFTTKEEIQVPVMNFFTHEGEVARAITFDMTKSFASVVNIAEGHNIAEGITFECAAPIDNIGWTIWMHIPKGMVISGQDITEFKYMAKAFICGWGHCRTYENNSTK